MQVQIDGSARVQQIGIGLGEREGCEILDVDDATYAAVREAIFQPNGGVILTNITKWDVVRQTARPASEATADQPAREAVPEVRATVCSATVTVLPVPEPTEGELQRGKRLAVIAERAKDDPGFAAIAAELGLLPA